MNVKLFLFLLIPVFGFGQVQIGQDIVGDMPDDNFGSSIALSADGNVLAVSAPNNDNNGTDAGQVRVYSKISGTWTQIGQDIEGNPNDKIGSSKMSLSDDGTIIAIPSPFSSSSNNPHGYVSVYKYINGIWTKLGQDIKENNTSEFGIYLYHYLPMALQLQ